MKKVIIAAIAGILALSNVEASIYVSWGDASGFVRNDGTTPIVGLGSALSWLVFSTDATLGAIYVDGSISGGDQVLAWTTFNSAGTGNDYGAGYGGLNYYSELLSAGSGYLFNIVFDRGSDAGLSAGMWYEQSEGFATADNAGPPSAPSPDITFGPAGSGDGPDLGGGYRPWILNDGQLNPICWQCLPGRGGWRATIH